MIRRVAFLLAFFPLGIVMCLAAMVGMVVAGVAWLVAGPDENRTDSILLNPVMTGICDLLFSIPAKS